MSQKVAVCVMCSCGVDDNYCYNNIIIKVWSKACIILLYILSAISRRRRDDIDNITGRRVGNNNRWRFTNSNNNIYANLLAVYYYCSVLWRAICCWNIARNYNRLGINVITIGLPIVARADVIFTGKKKMVFFFFFSLI